MTTSSPSLKPAPFWINFWDILTAPSLALQRVSSVQIKSWWFPGLLALLLPLLYVGATMPMQIEAAKKGAALSLSNMTPEQADAARSMVERMTTPGPLMLTATTSTTLGLLFGWALSLLILYFGISFLGDSIKASHLWAAVVWTWVPLALRSLVQLIWSLATHSMIHYQGLSVLLATGDDLKDQGSVLFALAAQVDVFAIWHLILVFLLLRVVGKLKAGASMTMTLIYALIYLGLGLLPVALLRLTSIG
jgi:hypothetical protein